MSDELKHASAGTILTQAEFEAAGLHVCDSQAKGDLVYASSSSQLSRLAVGSTSQRLRVNADGAPEWASPEVAKAYNDANQSIANTTWTVLALNSEVFDTNTMHDNVTNNSRITCKKAGIYLVIGHAAFAANATGIRELAFKLNGAANYYCLTSVQAATAASEYTALTIATLIEFAVNQYVEFQVYQSSTAALNIIYGANFSPYLMMYQIA